MPSIIKSILQNTYIVLSFPNQQGRLQKSWSPKNNSDSQLENQKQFMKKHGGPIMYYENATHTRAHYIFLLRKLLQKETNRLKINRNEKPWNKTKLRISQHWVPKILQLINSKKPSQNIMSPAVVRRIKQSDTAV